MRENFLSKNTIGCIFLNFPIFVLKISKFTYAVANEFLSRYE